MSEFSASQLGNSDTILFGRVTYELMARYWPTAEARKNDPAVTPWMNAVPKVVFSRTLATADWANSRIVREDASREVERLKGQPGRDIVIFGSANLMSGLTRSGLIDEFEVMFNPIVLGRGRPLFQELERPLRLKLLGSRTFRNGNVPFYTHSRWLEGTTEAIIGPRIAPAEKEITISVRPRGAGSRNRGAWEEGSGLASFGCIPG
jgi:dihydrofolate reductase